jgi:hypothetical protein
MKNFLVIAAMVAGASVASTPKSADAALILPAVATQAHSDVVSVQYRRRRTVVRIYRPRPQPRYYGPGSGMGREYIGPGSGSGVGRLIENGPGSGTGRGRF